MPNAAHQETSKGSRAHLAPPIVIGTDVLGELQEGIPPWYEHIRIPAAVNRGS